MSSPLLEMTDIAKRFGPVVALDAVSLSVTRGEVHALVGENGAGKSTLIKILAGAEPADAGRILFDSRPFSPKRPADAIRAGIAVVYQEFNLAPHLSILANLMLGRPRACPGLLVEDFLGTPDRKSCRAALDRLGLHLSLDTRICSLGVADQQMVEIARALLSRARLIVMDEPTSALASHEVQRLFAVISQLRRSGISIIYISHFLEELEAIADRVTILRDGRTVATGPMSEFPRPRIVHAMVGRDVAQMYPRLPHAIGNPILTVNSLAGLSGKPRSASFTLHAGEILGIAGLVGAGRTESLRTLFGLDPARSGVATLPSGLRLQRFSPHDWNRRAVALLSEDRKSEGLAQSLSCLHNITLAAPSRASLFGFPRPAAQHRAAAQLGRLLGIKWPSSLAPVRALSGGNQQKVAFARLLYSQADVLLLDEPTRGIDVGAKVDLYLAIQTLAQQGKGILVVSSYLPELLGICDRIAVMSRGHLGPARDVSSLTAQSVMHEAIGGEP